MYSVLGEQHAANGVGESASATRDVNASTQRSAPAAGVARALDEERQHSTCVSVHWQRAGRRPLEMYVVLCMRVRFVAGSKVWNGKNDAPRLLGIVMSIIVTVIVVDDHNHHHRSRSLWVDGLVGGGAAVCCVSGVCVR